MPLHSILDSFIINFIKRIGSCNDAIETAIAQQNILRRLTMEYDGNLEELRNPELGVIDLTGSNVQRLKGKKAKGALEPLLKRVLPRRQKGIEHSSYYRTLYAQILPYNPYFEKDVLDLRMLFHIPEEQIGDVDLTQFPDRLEPWDKEDVLNWRQVVGCWLQIHQCNAMKTQLDPGLPPLPQWLIDSASAILELGENAPVRWLQKEPNIPYLYSKMFDLRVPLDWCVTRLIERYRLPWQCAGNLQLFILTQKHKYLENMSPFDVIMKHIQAPIGQAYRVTIDWVDEYTTKKEWNEIYKTIIQPLQSQLWEKRGDLPHSKQIEWNNLTKLWLIDTYRLIVQRRLSGEKISVHDALQLLAKEEKWSSSGEEEVEVYRNIKKLDILCLPSD